MVWWPAYLRRTLKSLYLIWSSKCICVCEEEYPCLHATAAVWCSIHDWDCYSCVDVQCRHFSNEVPGTSLPETKRFLLLIVDQCLIVWEDYARGWHQAIMWLFDYYALEFIYSLVLASSASFVLVSQCDVSSVQALHKPWGFQSQFLISNRKWKNK